MKISTSILSIKEDRKNNIKKLGNTSTEYIHLDIMDGIFVPPKVGLLEEKEILLETKKPLDIHLMVEDVYSYIEFYKVFHPEYVTFHLETKQNITELIKEVKRISKVGLSMKPNTKIEEILPYLPFIDLVLVMSVEPGYGGQKFMMSSIEKIEELYKIREERGYPFVIEVDGGVNDENIHLLKQCDIIVAGSYITNAEDYEKQIRNLKN